MVPSCSGESDDADACVTEVVSVLPDAALVDDELLLQPAARTSVTMAAGMSSRFIGHSPFLCLSSFPDREARLAGPERLARVLPPRPAVRHHGRALWAAVAARIRVPPPVPALERMQEWHRDRVHAHEVALRQQVPVPRTLAVRKLPHALFRAHARQ